MTSQKTAARETNHGMNHYTVYRSLGVPEPPHDAPERLGTLHVLCGSEENPNLVVNWRLLSDNTLLKTCY